MRITGRVQGVAFRASTRDEASRHAVQGWVRNAADGSVEAVLQGPAGAVEAVVAWMRAGGPPAGTVHAVHVTEAPDEPAHEGFAIRR